MFLLERGVLDERALAAFVGGQCHGLALAIRQRTDWPLVAVDDEKDECVHICVRRPDGLLVDVTGSHSDDEMTADRRRLRIPFDRSDVDALVERFGWAPPELEAAAAWVEVVLERAETGPMLPPMATARISRDAFPAAYEVHFEWEANPWFSVQVRRPGQRDSVSYSRVDFTPDSNGGYLIDFREEEFDRLTEWFMAAQFDPRKAEAKLLEAGQ